MKKLKKMIMPLTMACVMVVGATSVFASDGKEINNDRSGIVKPFLYEYDLQKDISTIEDAKGGIFTPTYKYGKVWFQNNSSKDAKVIITKNGKEITSFTILANSSNHKYCKFSNGKSYNYAVKAIDGSVVPVGKIVIKTGETETDVE